MTVSDLKGTVIGIINGVRVKLGIASAATLTSDKQALTSLRYLNDVLSITSDYGNWKEQRRETTVTASSSVRTYDIESSALVKNIREISFDSNSQPLTLTEEEDVKRLVRTGSTGSPRQWCILGVNSTTGNPQITVVPQPGSNETGKLFEAVWYKKPRLYAITDASAVVPFPKVLIENGLHSMMLLDESRGTQNIDFVTQFKAIYEPMLEETFNRFNGDSGNTTYFTPRRR